MYYLYDKYQQDLRDKRKDISEFIYDIKNYKSYVISKNYQSYMISIIYQLYIISRLSIIYNIKTINHILYQNY